MRQLAFIVASAQSIKNIFYSRSLLKRPYPPAHHLPRSLTRHLAAHRMGGANGSRECAPDDKLRDTHPLHFIEMMGFAGSTHPVPAERCRDRSLIVPATIDMRVIRASANPAWCGRRPRPTCRWSIRLERCRSTAIPIKWPLAKCAIQPPDFTRVRP
jgi:hypothetical protein